MGVGELPLSLIEALPLLEPLPAPHVPEITREGTCWKYLSPLMYSLSCESCSLLVFTYCHRACTMAERLCVCKPSSRARRGSSLNWGGWEKTAVKIKERGLGRTQGQAAGAWGDVIIGLLGNMLLEKMR